MFPTEFQKSKYKEGVKEILFGACSTKQCKRTEGARALSLIFFRARVAKSFLTSDSGKHWRVGKGKATLLNALSKRSKPLYSVPYPKHVRQDQQVRSFMYWKNEVKEIDFCLH